MRCPNKLSPAGEASQSLTANPTQRSRAGVYPAFSFDIQAFGLCLAFGFRHLNLVDHPGSRICLPASLRPFAGAAKTNARPTKRIVRTLTTESAGGSRSTYGENLLNSAKNSHFSKTNPLRLHRASPPALTARRNKWQTDETNRGTFTVKCAGANRPTYEEQSSNSWKTTHSYKTNHPGFPAIVAHAASVKWDILER